MVVLYYLGRFLIFFGVTIYNAINPKEIPAPAAIFGPLPILKMPTYTIKGNAEYVLETDSGALPTFPDRLNVYKFEKPKPNLLAESNMKTLATNLNFSGGFTKKDISIFQWIDGTAGRNMNGDVITQQFTVKTKLDKLGAVLTSASTITEDDATTTVGQFIKSQLLLPNVKEESIRYETIPTIVNLAKYQDTSKYPKQAKVIKVNVFESLKQRTPLLPETEAEIEYKILGPNPKNSIVSFWVTNASKPYQIAEIDYTNWTITEEKSDYGLSNINNVWDTIKQGKGVIAYLKLNDDDYYTSYNTPIDITEIRIRNVYIAYYEPKEFTPYAQPIYVFEGAFKTKNDASSLSKKGDIVIYYPAIQANYIEQPAQEITVKEEPVTTKPEIKNTTPEAIAPPTTNAPETGIR